MRREHSTGDRSVPSGMSEGLDRRHDAEMGQTRRPPKSSAGACVFCEIVSGRAPAHHVEVPGSLHGGPLSERVRAFHNRLDWARVMLLVAPATHMTQAGLWAGSVLPYAAKAAIQLGEQLCPEGFRLISNIGRAAHQSQPHAHMHMVSGTDQRVGSAGFQRQRPTPVAHMREPRLILEEVEISGVTWARRIRLESDEITTQAAFWTDPGFRECARVAVDLGESESPAGFRLISNFPTEASVRQDPTSLGLYILGGGQLDLYM